MKVIKPRKCFLIGLPIVILFHIQLSSAQTIEALRIEDFPLPIISNPIISKSSFTNLNPDTGESDGRNINGASLIRVPTWIPSTEKVHPLANYYLYFADHGGRFIRMAWANEVRGPWQLFNYGAATGRAWGETENNSGSETPLNGVLDLGVEKDALGNPTWRIQPHPNYYALGHIASPDVHVDHANQRIIMFYHAPKGGSGNSGQQTFVAVSKYGLNFNKAQTEQEIEWGQGTRAVIPGHFYFRAFQVAGMAMNPTTNELVAVKQWFAFSNRGVLYKAPTFDANGAAAELSNSDEIGGLFTPTENHPIGTNWWESIANSNNPLAGIEAPLTLRDYSSNTYGTQRVVDDRNNGARHFAIFHDEQVDRDKIFVLYTGRADASESIVLVTFDLEGLSESERIDPTLWKRKYTTEKIILTPEKEWEGGNLNGLYVSRPGAATNVKALRDPAIFKDIDGQLYLLYSGKGEEAIGVAVANIIPSFDLDIKVHLQGALMAEDETYGFPMRSDLSQLESFPAEGYDLEVTTMIHQEEPITNAMLNFSEDRRPVDWVIVELRVTPTTISYAKEAILLANGAVVDVDNSPVSFDNINTGDYYVAVKHRNHLAIMTKNKVSIH